MNFFNILMLNHNLLRVVKKNHCVLLWSLPRNFMSILCQCHGGRRTFLNRVIGFEYKSSLEKKEKMRIKK